MKVQPKIEAQTGVFEAGINLDCLKTDDLDDFYWESSQEQENDHINLRTQINSQNKANGDINKSQLPQFQRNHFRMQQIQKSLEIVKRAFPETFTDQIIDELFKNLMQKMNNPTQKIPSPIIPLKAKPIQVKKTSKRSNYSKSISYQQNFITPPQNFPNSKKKIREQKKNGHPLSIPVNRINSVWREQRESSQKGIAGRLEKIWAQQLQELLLTLYKKGHQFSFIRDHFQEEYPQYQELFTVNSLRGKFYKVIRQTIRKLHTFIEQIGRQYFPNMIKLSYNIIQNIMYQKVGRPLRYLFIDLYFCDRLDKVLVNKIIDNIHKFINDAENQANELHPFEVD